MDFEIDVSGEDIFNKNYTICIANKDGIIKGFKFDSKLGQVINSRHGQGLYPKYKKSNKGNASLKVRVYCIIIYFLFKSIKKKIKNVNLAVCRDFSGRENDIKINLEFLFTKLKIDLGDVMFVKLPSDSSADHYAGLMRQDNKNKMKTYVNITLKDIEKFLKKK